MEEAIERSEEEEERGGEERRERGENGGRSSSSNNQDHLWPLSQKYLLFGLLQQSLPTYNLEGLL